MRSWFIVALASALLAGCIQPLASEVPDEPDASVDPIVRFVLLGDMGEGNAGQYQVGRAIESVCAARGCDFVLGLGDNIYDSGVTSPNDPQFESKFEEPYHNLTLPFYMSLGNHDNGEEILGQEQGLGSDSRRGDHQVAYHYRTDRASEKWQMPSRYYTFTWHHAQFFALDTNTMMWMGDPQTARDPLVLQQAEWLDREITASDKTWKFTFGHHPYVSNGQHGDAGEMEGVPGLGILIQRTLEEVACDRVNAHLAGHDHDMQWLAPVASCGDTEFLISGAGSKARELRDPSDHEAFFQQGATLGFAWIELDGTTFTGAYFDADANPLYERSFTKTP